jgi:hypothetical protein
MLGEKIARDHPSTKFLISTQITEMIADGPAIDPEASGGLGNSQVGTGRLHVVFLRRNDGAS